MLTCKQCIRSIRAKTRIGWLIKSNEQMKIVGCGKVKYGRGKERISRNPTT